MNLKKKPTKAYKLFKVRKDGTIGPLFIGASKRLPIGVWLEAEDIPTKGYAKRPGWHCGLEPVAPHLSIKGRAWFEVTVKDYYLFQRPQHQGSKWVIAKAMKINRQV